MLQNELPSDTWHRRRRHEVTDEVVIQTIKLEMDIDMYVKDIDRTHRIGAKSENKRRPIIVKFARYSERRKKRLKGKNLSITESLTKLRMRKLKQREMNMVFEMSGQSMERSYTM